MAVARRTRRVGVPPQEVWALVEDPHSMPRWWPDVRRMEDVQEDRWTQVFMTKKGKAVRADYNLLESEPPGPDAASPGRRVWEQELAGTPFERVLSESIITLVVEPAEGGSLITLAHHQRLRGASRTGGFLLRRATTDKLNQALDGIERAVG
jgi:uncharacterized protein YndB with AHSA1/START domain